YLTGLEFHLMERPILTLFSRTNPPIIVLPELEKTKVIQLPYPLTVITYGENPATWLEEFRKCRKGINSSPISLIGVEETYLRFLELEFLNAVFPSSEIRSCQSLISELRIRKDEMEKGWISQAIRIAEEALTNTLSIIKPGITEKELASELVIQLLHSGSDPQLPFFPIIASGQNSANPHATPTERNIQIGDPVIIDWGARYHGYISDLTRTFVIGKATQEFEHIYKIVKNANMIGSQSVFPGIKAGEIDRLVRNLIVQNGFGDYFRHRTGHGIGLETHEEPYIRSENEQILQPGMTFTIEPGIYLPQKFGVRIEDNVFVNDNGAEILSTLSRDLIAL
ncbi:MAG: M24 family metallopeptidase, partial [Anaerolineales bacterium]